MVDSLAPKPDGNIAFEQPVGQPSGLQGISVLTGLLGAADRGRDRKGPSAFEVKNDALKPLADALNRANGIADTSKRAAAVRKVQTDFILSFPALENEAIELGETISGIGAKPTELTQEDAVTTGLNEFLQTSQGQTDYLRSIVKNPDGTIDTESTGENLVKFMFENNAKIAELEASNRRLSLLENDEKALQIEGTKVFDTLLNRWGAESSGIVEGLIEANSLETGADPRLDDPEEQLAFLRAMRREKLEVYRAELRASGVPSSISEGRLEQTVKPFDDAIELIVEHQADFGKILTGRENAAKVSVGQEFFKTVGDLGFIPAFQKAIIEAAVADTVLSERFPDLLGAFANPEQLRSDNILDLPSLISGSSDGRGPDGVDQPINPTQEAVELLRNKEGEKSGAINGQIDAAITIIKENPEDSKAILDGAASIAVAGSAAKAPLANSKLLEIFRSPSWGLIAGAAEVKDVNGTTVSKTIAGFVVEQKRRNQALLSEQARAFPPGFSVSGDNELVFDVRELDIAINDRAHPQHSKSVAMLEGLRDRGIDPTNSEEVMNLLDRGGAGILGPDLGTLRIARKTIANIDLLDQVSSNPSFAVVKDKPEVVDEGGITENLSSVPLPREVRDDVEFISEVDRVASVLNTTPKELMQVIRFETAGTFSPSIRNPGEGQTATGLIQFIESTAKGLGTSTAELARMSRAQQMKFVEKYLVSALRNVPEPNFGDLYMAILWPRAVGKDDSFVLWREGESAYGPNRNLDSNKDGTVTRGEAVARAASGGGSGGTGRRGRRGDTPLPLPVTLDEDRDRSGTTEIFESVETPSPVQANPNPLDNPTLTPEASESLSEGGQSGEEGDDTASSKVNKEKESRAISILIQRGFDEEGARAFLREFEGLTQAGGR